MNAQQGQLGAAMVRLALRQAADEPQDSHLRPVVGYAAISHGLWHESLSVLPGSAHALRAIALSSLGRVDEAVSSVDRAEREDDPLAALAASHVMCVRLADGRPLGHAPAAERPAELAARFMRANDLERALGQLAKVSACLPPWCLGAPELDVGGKRVPKWNGMPTGHLVIVAGCGHGDVIMLGRYLVAARRACARMTVLAARPVQSIVERLIKPDAIAPVSQALEVLAEACAYHPVDYELASAVGQTYGRPLPLTPLPERVPTLERGVRHVGVCWDASVRGLTRSMQAQSLAPLEHTPATQFHSLQVGPAAKDAPAWITRHALRDYEDTTGLVAALDEVITVDTSVVTVSGSMNKPTCLLLPMDQHAIWGPGDRTPWFPPVKIYRGAEVGRAIASQFLWSDTNDN